MESFNFNRDRFDFLISEMLERELSRSEEEELIQLCSSNKDAAAEYATLVALTNVRALNHHEATAAVSRAKFLAKAKQLKTTTKVSLFARFWSWLLKPRSAFGLPVIAAQIALVLVYFQALVPSDSQQSLDEPVYRGSQGEVCASYEISLDDQADLNSLVRMFSQAGINIVEGPSLEGTFRVNAPGLGLTEFRELTKGIVGEVVELDCDRNE